MFEVGQRVRAVSWAPSAIIDDNLTVPPGTLGTVVFVDDWQTAHTKWDNGATLGICDNDVAEVVDVQKEVIAVLDAKIASGEADDMSFEDTAALIYKTLGVEGAP